MNTQPKKKFFTRKKVAGGLSILLIVALLLGGTYAWQNFTQHKTNIATGGQFVDVTLNDSYTPPVRWDVGQTLGKEVSVTNPANSTDPVYVRLQFKEYLERYEMNLVDGGALFATYADGPHKGDFMLYTDAQAAGYNYQPYNVNGTVYCLTDNTELRDGIYGKQMYAKSDLEIFDSVSNPTSPTKMDFPNNDTQTTDPTDECDYPVHIWNNCDISNNGDTIDDYISWALGPDVKTMAEWKTLGYPMGNYWVLDTTDGWAYWVSPIQPGASTSNIMDSITLNNMPGSQFEYQIHIDQQAVTADDLGMLRSTASASNGQRLIDILSGEIVPLTAPYFPDKTFLYVLIGGYWGGDSPEGGMDSPDTNGNGFLTRMERSAVTLVDVSNLTTISDLTGIQYFPNLTKLYCESTQLQTLDVSHNPALETLTCNDNQLSSLDVSKNTALTNLNCSNNSLSSLDVSKNTALTQLNCNGNQLDALNVSKNTALTQLNCNGNQLDALNVSNNTALTSLDCGGNQLTDLDFRMLPLLNTLHCNDNQLTSLDVSRNPALRYLDCSYNQISSLDVSMTVIVQPNSLIIQNNGMTSLTINSTQQSKNFGTFAIQTTGNSLAITVTP